MNGIQENQKSECAQDVNHLTGTPYQKESWWKKAVKERDNYTCQRCGSKKFLHTHHKKPRKQFPELLYDLNNGETLCKVCHRIVEPAVKSTEFRNKISALHKGRKHTEETKKKFSESHIGKTPWNKGKKMSAELRQKLSISHKGLPSGNKGKKHSEEAKRKMSASWSYEKHLPGMIKAGKSAKLPMSQEAKDKISASVKKNWKSQIIRNRRRNETVGCGQ